MTVPILPSTVAQANAYLASFPPEIQSRGETYYRDGRVEEVDVNRSRVSAKVQGSESYPYLVTLRFHRPMTWTSECTCPMGVACKHAYAALKAAIAESSVAAVQQLSSGIIEGASVDKEVQGFSDEIAKALDRPLKRDELKFLVTLSEVFAENRHFAGLTPKEFSRLGLRIGGHQWQMLEMWPDDPDTLQEFWLYVARIAQQRGLRLPEFLVPVTDLRKIEKKLARWERSKEIAQWEENLAKATVSAPAARTPVRHELRVRFTTRAAVLEWKPPGQQDFVVMKKADGREFRFQWRDGLIELSPVVELLSKPFRRQLDYGSAPEIRYNEDTFLVELGHMLRVPIFEEFIINPDGNRFQRDQMPLHWHLEPAKDEDDSYHLRIALPDGSPLPELLCVFPGHPTLFVTRTTIYQGPPVTNDAIAPNRDNVIPAPALETQAGVALLHSLGMELPPRVQERVQVVPLHMAVSCWLSEKKKNSDEVCYIRVTAQTPDGKVMESYRAGKWSAEVKPEKPGRKKDEKIIAYDRRALRPARVFAGLSTQWTAHAEDLFVSVTKKFPQEFGAWIKGLPPETRLDLKGELASFAQEALAGRIRLEATEADIDWFDLKIVLDVADTTLSQEELSLLLDAKGGYVRLPGKGWHRVQFALGSEEDEQLARLGLNPRELTSEPQRLHALQLSDTAAKRFLPEAQFEDIQRRAGEIKARVTPEMPVGIQATLRPYQTEGFHFLAYLAENRFGGILADDMGLGKTVQTLTWLAWLRSGRGQTGAKMAAIAAAPSLVVCPKSVTDNWRVEAERFLPGLRVKIWHGYELSRFAQSTADADLHVLNYSQLRSLADEVLPVRWLALILDEGQYIKNPTSQTAEVARALKAHHRLILSGTPIENRLLDLWSLMAFAMPGVLGSRTKFAKIYDAKEDPLARRRLSARVRPFLLRRTKSQVAKDLPDRIEEDLFCEMEGEQKTLYRAELKRAQQMLLLIKTQKQLAKERFHVLTSLLRLRQIACHPRLVKPDSTAESAKVEALMEQLEPLLDEGHKVLIFSQFVEMLDILKAKLESLKVPLFYLAGHTENRGELVQRFQETEGSAIFLISLKAGGFGLNLTAASYVVLFDPWWNPAVENQAIDRTHRIGQTRNVIAYRLLLKDSIEEKIRHLQKTKSALADDVLGEEKFSQSLNLDDLQFLFSDA